jgi:chemotaxis protein methyltransferase CheR
VREIDRGALEALAALLLEHAGLRITPSGFPGLTLALSARLATLGERDAIAYVRGLGHKSGEAELRALLPYVTVGKTEFFRDPKQLIAFERHVLPERLALARSEKRPVRVWSAGCATGEEPYSLAIAGVEQGAGDSVDIWATDLNPQATETAARGVYPQRRLAGLSQGQIRRYFRPVDGRYQVADSVRGLVRFASHNLAAPSWPQASWAAFDVIFCRNVLIYFDPATIEVVLGRFCQALRPGGWLFLGYAESLLKETARFEMVEVEGTFVYRRTLHGRPRPRGGGRLPPPSVPAPTRRQVRLPAPPSEPSSSTPEERLRHVTRAVESGDFSAALRLARRLVEDAPIDLAARLTLGNIHILLGNQGGARDAFMAVLAQEPLCLEARLFLGVAALGAGALEEAKLELTRALFLEPSLRLGHYLLGQVHERLGDLEGARRCYRNAARHHKAPAHRLLGHFPDLPQTNEAIAEAARHRLAALAEEPSLPPRAQWLHPRGLRD